MNADGPIVELRLQSRPQTLTIVRGMLSGVAEQLEMDPELLDDLKTAVSEACNNVVLHAYGASTGPMEIRLFVDEAITVVVCDEGAGLPPSGASLDASTGIGVSVIQALAARAGFAARPDGGTEVTMRFAGERDGTQLFTAPRPAAAAAELELAPANDGEIALTLSPISLLDGVLGRLARTLAASAHFSLDRFSDVYLITDTLAAHAARAAVGDRIAARIEAGERRLQLAVGPFRRGSGEALAGGDADRVSSPLALLADEVAVRGHGDDECVDVVVVDHRR